MTDSSDSSTPDRPTGETERGSSGGVGSEQVLVIGVGNRSRGDDGVGVAVAEAVAVAVAESVPERSRGGVRVEVVDGDLSSLPLLWAATDDVVVIDAAVMGQAGGGAGTGCPPCPGTVVEFDGLDHEWPIGTGLSTHGFGLAAAVELARRLDRLPESLTVLAIVVDPTATVPLTPMSLAASEAVDVAVDRIVSRL